MNTRYRAFTLVELLVVVGILAVVMSILIPTVGKARKQAYTVRCMGNQRQLIAATLMYTRDNDDLLPNTGWGHGGARNWLYNDGVAMTGKQSEVQGGQLWKYLNTANVYHCPQDHGPWPTGSSNNLTSYCLNGAATAYSGNSGVGLNILRFHPNDVLFWEFAMTKSGTNGGNDGTNYPSEGVTARHKHGTVVSHIDGHVDVIMAEEFNKLCQPGAGPNMLYCDPTQSDGGVNGGLAWPHTPIAIQEE
jgi:prepilin-type N-terminal cleavage/methylation domain-containing protein